jgi:hypothetical protein
LRNEFARTMLAHVCFCKDKFFTFGATYMRIRGG